MTNLNNPPQYVTEDSAYDYIKERFKDNPISSTASYIYYRWLSKPDNDTMTIENLEEWVNNLIHALHR